MMKSPEKDLAHKLAGVETHNCSEEEKEVRRMNLIQSYIHENYREIKEQDPWWQDLAMHFLRGLLWALGATLVFGFFFATITFRE